MVVALKVAVAAIGLRDAQSVGTAPFVVIAAVVFFAAVRVVAQTDAQFRIGATEAAAAGRIVGIGRPPTHGDDLVHPSHAHFSAAALGARSDDRAHGTGVQLNLGVLGGAHDVEGDPRAPRRLGSFGARTFLHLNVGRWVGGCHQASGNIATSLTIRSIVIIIIIIIMMIIVVVVVVVVDFDVAQTLARLRLRSTAR